MHTMRIYKQDKFWMVTDNDPKVLELFGTDTLPTPFAASTPVSLVLATLAKLNPDATIELRT